MRFTFVWNCVLWNELNTKPSRPSTPSRLEYSPTIPEFQNYRRAHPDPPPHCSHLHAMPLPLHSQALLSLEVFSLSTPDAFCTKLYSRSCQKFSLKASRVKSKYYNWLVEMLPVAMLSLPETCSLYVVLYPSGSELFCKHALYILERWFIFIFLLLIIIIILFFQLYHED